MTPGEPLEEIKENGLKTADPSLTDSALDEPVPDQPVTRPAEMAPPPRTPEQAVKDTEDDERAPEDDATLLDQDVRTLLHEIAEEEAQHDEEWVATSRREAWNEDDAFEKLEREILDGPEAETVGTEGSFGVEEAPDSVTAGDGEVIAAPTLPDDEIEVASFGKSEREAVEEPIEASANIAEADDSPAVEAAHDSIANGDEETFAGTVSRDDNREATAFGKRDHEVMEEPGEAVADTAETGDDSVALRAIDNLGNRFEASEARTEEALGRIGHALGMIATRIDGLETRATDRTIADVALVAAPPDEDDDDENDISVAPYIARAEKELKARKGSGSMDIFDRIARAAETEFDDQAGSVETRVLANATDGRRVGTKKWQPSKAVKKRMEKLEQARANSVDNGVPPGRRPPAAALDPQVMEEPVAPVRAAQIDEPDMAAEAAPEPAFVADDDEGNLSVVPGARGRRRNRARKSSLDSDFENVFSEEGDKPSIQSLRRKMRDRPVEAPAEDEKGMGGMLGGMLGRKSAKKGEAPEPVVEDENVEDEMMAAFDAPDDTPAPAKSKKKKKAAAKVKPVDPEDDYDDEDEDWDDEDETGTRRKGLIYMLVVFLATAAGYMVWKMFLA